jgi:glycogen debranching enzyme
MGEYPVAWENHLKGLSERGYNMVHFTPLMIRGASNSPYSIYDQHRFDTAYFPNGETDIASLITKMEKSYGLLAMTDVVLNHTAHNSKWLEEHPEAGYNVETAPWLESAYELDTALLKFSDDLHSLGLPTDINTVDELLRILDAIKSRVLGSIKLWEYYILDVERDCKDIVQAWKEGQVTFPDRVGAINGASEWPLKQKADWLIDHALLGGDRLGERYRRRVDAPTGAALLSSIFGRFDPSNSQEAEAAQSAMVRCLEEANLQFYREYDMDSAEVMEQLFNRIKYMRIDDHGPRLGTVTKENPLIEPYFTRLPLNETTRKHHKSSLALVNNGWVWAADAMRDNAGPKSRAYLRREVIVWGDCVKLRYGSGPEDNPFLWDFMAKYVRLMAKYFRAFRIDNCHSTPLHVAEYMLDQARIVQPDLMVAAELFTGNKDMDFKFCMRLGLSCLIREAMQAWSTQEMSRLVHMHAGIPIGSFELDEIVSSEATDHATANTNGTVLRKEVMHHIRESPVHAMFMDCTHDNEVPAQKRDARDTLPNAALVAMCSCATGSVMGYDEIYPRLIELVHEKRLYKSPYSTGKSIEIGPGEGGIGTIKKLLNNIHVTMGKEGYDETYIHHDNEYITVHRVHPKTRKGYFCIAHTAYPGYGTGNGGFPPVTLPGTKAKCIGGWKLEVDTSPSTVQAAIDDKYLRGLPSKVTSVQGLTISQQGDATLLHIPNDFPPGCVALYETWVPTDRHDSLDAFITSNAKSAFSKLDHIDLNFLLYRCDPEERDMSGGKEGAYSVPGFGSLVYCGIQGWWSPLQDIIRDNDLGHPICNHLREGYWALDYTAGRLERASKDPKFGRLADPAKWLRDRFEAIKTVPSFMCPRYFALTIQTAFNAARDRSIELMSDNIKDGQDFLKSLAMVSVQLIGYMNNASLWPNKLVPSLSAGLPHFSSDWARCWGRDIMISLPGLAMCTGRYDIAREHILAFASVLKHGMIPNLLGAGKLPRYNSRDSVWFFLQNIQEYTKFAPGGKSLLQEKVKRRFTPYDDEWFPWDDERAYSHASTVEDVIQEVMQRHASGIHFREHNAGPNIDSQMRDQGFNIDIDPDWETGFIFGGNQWNCGTWMDKMGESEKAGSKGVPGTPRDGAAIEIIGMLYSACAWLADLKGKGIFKYEGVTTDNGTKTITYSAWASLIKRNFERCYYVPVEPKDDTNYDVNSQIINRRGIYKDLYRSGKEYEDYQLRPNICIAMAYAPDLFDDQHALQALYMCDRYLRGPQGMATLDPSDLNYRPYYVNSEDSTDFHTSKGRNYHQGPEWVWPLGFFLRAFLHFYYKRCKTSEERVDCFQQVTKRLAGNIEAIRTSPWAGLTELTNKDGAFCADSVSYLPSKVYLYGNNWANHNYTVSNTSLVSKLPSGLGKRRRGAFQRHLRCWMCYNPY